MRLIDADALIEKSLKDANCYMDNNDIKHGYHNVQCLIYDAPTIDAVPVVRCKDCKRRKSAKENGKVYWDGYKYYCEIARYGVTDGGFCFYGERKDDE